MESDHGHITAAGSAEFPASATPPTPEELRDCGWVIGEARASEKYTPGRNHASLAMVAPKAAFAYWRITPEWVEAAQRQRGAAWDGCRLVLRLYDVTCLIFNGFNAHRMQDVLLHRLAGQVFCGLPRAGTSQLGEVGFLLRSNEFVPAARSQAVLFARDSAAPQTDNAALLVDENLQIQHVPNVYEQESAVREHRRPKLRKPVRFAVLAFEAAALGHDNVLARFVSSLAGSVQHAGHEVQVFLPRSPALDAEHVVDGVRYQPLDFTPSDDPLWNALNYGRAAEKRLLDLPPFDVFHHHEWTTCLVPWFGTRPTVMSLTSIEATRRGDNAPTELSSQIEKTEREVARQADLILTPDWLKHKALSEYALDDARVHAVAMEGRVATEWDCELDVGRVKGEFGFGPFDRLLTYVGPLEYAAGVDLLIEALAHVHRRAGDVRVAYVGAGAMYNPLHDWAAHAGVGHAIKLLGHVPYQPLVRLLRVSEALILPSRQRVDQDEGVVDLARRAGLPVITTHSGPAWLVRHEHDGLVVYDNPGSLIWGVERLVHDPGRARYMGSSGRRGQSAAQNWDQVARSFLDLCAQTFPELTSAGQTLIPPRGRG
jgi:glycosyltransferase involved in cell wall biosynthesis